MNANKLLVAGAALVALTAIPAAIAWSASTSSSTSHTPRSEAVAAAADAAPSAQRAPDAAANARESAAAPVGEFRGRVVAADGTPIAGATVGLWPDWRAESMRDEGATSSQVGTASAADGTFALTPLRHEKWGIHVAARHDDHVAVSEHMVCRPGEPATIVMLRVHEVPLTVEVTDRRTGIPVPRFHVVGSTTLRASDESAKAATGRQLKAPDREVGIAGVFRGTARFVEGLPFDVLAQCPGNGRDGFGDHTDPIPRATLQPRAGEAIHLRFTVAFDLAEEHARVVQRGRIVDAQTGAPIAGATVGWTRDTLHQPYRYVQSRADGTFTIALPDEGAVDRLRVTHDDCQPLAVPPDPSSDLTVRLGPLGSLRCRVVDRNGVPVAGAAILVKAERDDALFVDSFQARRRTDAAGVVQLERLAARSYYVNLLRRFGDADDHALTTVHHRVAAGQHLEATLEVEPAAAVPVTGRITGAPAGLTAAYLPFEGTGRLAQARLTGGSYDAGALRPGDYLVLLLAANDDDDHLPKALLPKVTVQGPGPQGIDLALPVGFVRGRVTTGRERDQLRVLAVPELPAGGTAADLLARDKTTKFLGAPLGPDGSFEVKHVADGPWLLQLRDGATVVAQRAITVTGSLDVGDWPIEK